LRIVVQAYGRKDIIDQSIFSVLTVLRWNSSDEVWIYTDQVQRLTSFFKSTPRVVIVAMTPEKIKAWRGEIDFVHRVKLEVLKQASQNLNEPLLYLDGDTIFLQSPDSLRSRMGPGHHLMHLEESRLDQARDPLTKKMAKFCRKNVFPLRGGVLQVPSTTSMWNAGVIGLHPQHFDLLDQMIEFTDVAYARYQKHVIEQLAVSYFLQSTGKVSPSDDVIHHYWQTKEVWQQKIDSFLLQAKTSEEGLQMLKQFDWTLPVPPRKKKWWQKFLRREI
jgi:hypothetical protein